MSGKEKKIKLGFQNAVTWYRKTREQGDAKTQCDPGVKYDFGQGVEQDHQQAVAWYRKAAEQGHVRAQANLDDMYLQGHGRVQDAVNKGRLYLIFDTETSGLPRNYDAPATDTSNWPRLVQLGWVLLDADGNEVDAAEYIIRPENFTIPHSASNVHGITTEIALRDGEELHVVLDAFEKASEHASVLVAHNMKYDERVLGAEFIRAGRSDIVASKPRRCTMRGSTTYCKLPGRYGYKWPTLQELHMKLFAKPFQEEHSALADARACARAFIALKKLGVEV